MQNIIDTFNKAETITDEMIASATNRCIEKNFDSDGIAQLKTLAEQCKTKSDCFRFFKDTLKLDVEESKKGVVLHLHKTECTCPMASKLTVDKKRLCDCTKSRERYVWSQVFGREVDVEVLESFWRGGKDCVLEIIL